MLGNLIWLDGSILRRHTIGMQSTSPIQLRSQNSLSSSPLSRPDLATTLHNLLNYSRFGKETDILTSARLHVKQALFGSSSRSSPPMLSGSTLCFHFVEQIIPQEEVIFYRRAMMFSWCEWNGHERASTELTGSTKRIGQPTANKARG